MEKDTSKYCTKYSFMQKLDKNENQIKFFNMLNQRGLPSIEIKTG